MDFDQYGSLLRLVLGAIRARYRASFLQIAAEVEPLIPDDSPLAGVDRVATAIEALVGAELIANEGNQSFVLTPQGEQALADPSTGLSLEELSGHPSFIEWLSLQQLRGTFGVSDTLPHPEATGFERLEIGRWRQFIDVDIAFHSRLTVLTGANGSGKTTLLNLLGRHFDWNVQLLAARDRSRRAYVDVGFDPDQGASPIGQLTYRWGRRAKVLASYGSASPTFDAFLQPQDQVHGLFISSHRSLSGYRPLTSLPAEFSSAETLLSQFATEIRNRYGGSGSASTPFHTMKQALVAAALFGEGNRAVRPNAEADAVWTGFQEVLRFVLPSSLGFRAIAVDAPDLIVETDSGSFLLEALSGGLSSIFEMSWQIFLRSRQHQTFTVCIDEPENHLHPELQRALLPGLLRAFPSIAFITATHSPFIITSVKDSYVYSLLPDGQGIRSHPVAEWSRAGTPDSVLMRVLGLDSTLPSWAEAEMAQVVAQVPPSPTAADLRILRHKLMALGLLEQFPAALDAIEDAGQ